MGQYDDYLPRQAPPPGLLEGLFQNPLNILFGQPTASPPVAPRKEASKTYTAPSSLKAQQEMAMRMRPSNVSEAAALSGSKGLKWAGAATDFGTALAPWLIAKGVADKEAANNAVTQDVTQRMLAADPSGRAAILGASPDAAQRNIAVEMQLKADEEARQFERQKQLFEYQKRLAQDLEREDFQTFMRGGPGGGGGASPSPQGGPVPPSDSYSAPGIAVSPPVQPGAAAPSPQMLPPAAETPSAPQPQAAPPPPPATRQGWAQFYQNLPTPIQGMFWKAWKKGDVGELHKLYDEVMNPNKKMEEEVQKKQGELQGQARAALPGTMATTDRLLSQIDEVLGDKNLSGVTGPLQGKLPTFSGKKRDLEEKIKQLHGGVFLQAYNELRGAGSITEKEAEPATASFGRLKALDQSDKGYRKALEDAKREVVLLKELAHKKAGIAVPEAIATAADQIRAARAAGKGSAPSAAAPGGSKNLKWDPLTNSLSPIGAP